MSKESFEQKVLIYDSKKCSGCIYCMIVCSFHHFGVIDLDKSYIRVYRDNTGTGKASFVNAYCAHCDYPLCEAACPTEPKAIVKDPQLGFVTIDRMRCIGCRSCVYACPISIPIFDEAAGVSSKCDFCGGEPLCAKYCSTGALRVVSREEARRLMEAGPP